MKVLIQHVKAIFSQYKYYLCTLKNMWKIWTMQSVEKYGVTPLWGTIWHFTKILNLLPLYLASVFLQNYSMENIS